MTAIAVVTGRLVVEFFFLVMANLITCKALGKAFGAQFLFNNINMVVNSGEKIGIIGPNGSGKSTILKLIAGVTVPTDGSVKVHGRVAPLIELGAGFHFELTGRENVYINGSILGLKKKEIRTH